MIGNIKQISREFFDKVSEAADVEEIKHIKTSINDLANFDSLEDDSMTKVDLKATEKKKRKTSKKQIKEKSKTF